MGYDMYWVESANAEARARYDSLRRQWDTAVLIYNAIPKEERGQYTEKELEAGITHEAPNNASDRYKEAYESVNRLYGAMRGSEIWYYRRNEWGMRILREVMLKLDMVRSEYSLNECPFPWPDYDDLEDQDGFFYWDNGNWTVDDEVALEVKHPGRLKQWREYRNARSDRLTWVPEQCFKVLSDGIERYDETPHAIPIHKFGSNDGWIVTSTECTRVLAKAKSFTDDEIRLAHNTEWDPIPSWQSWLAFLKGAAAHGGFTVN